MESRSIRERRLGLARRRLDTANEALRLAHDMPAGDDRPGRRAELIQIAQEHVVTIEQEVALLSDGLARVYPDADTTYSSSDPV